MLGLRQQRDVFMWLADALKGWHDFYLLVGTAGATLLALLFVAVSLGTGFLTEERRGATRTFMSPVVIHFTSVFFLSAVALFPSHQAKFFAALISATALIGATVSTYITVQVVRTDMTNYMEDYFAYGILPSLGYLTLFAAAVSIYLEKDFGLDALAGALLLLAIINIRNAWDLTLTMVRRHPRDD
jgi:hypothetical protein